MEDSNVAVEMVEAEIVNPEAAAALELMYGQPDESEQAAEVVALEGQVIEAAPAVEEPKAKPPRVCAICGHPSGNSVGKIRKGRLVKIAEDGLELLRAEPICDPCGEKLPPEEQRKLFKMGYLIGLVGERNKATREFAERQAREAAEFAAAKVYWAEVVSGKVAEYLPEHVENGGKLVCGVPDCTHCHNSAQPVEHFVAMMVGSRPALIGICNFQAAALAQCGVEKKNVFATTNYGEAKRRVDEESARIASFEAAEGFWKRVADDEAEIAVRAEWPENGDPTYKCGVPNCKCREHGDRPVEHFVVLDGLPEMPIAGICRYQFAALKASGAKLFASSNADGTGLAKCEKHRRWAMGQAKRAIRAATTQFGEIGGGLARYRSPEKAAELRGKKRETREAREKRRRERSLRDQARHRAIGDLPRPGEQLGHKKKGGKGGDKKR